MASKEGEAPSGEGQPVAEQPAPTPPPAEAPADAPAEATAPAPSETPAAEEGQEASPSAPEEGKPEKPGRRPRKPLDPEEAAKRKAERLVKRKEQRKAARQAAKEAKASGEPAPAKPKPAGKGKAAAVTSDLQVPEGAAPKISITKLSSGMTVGELKGLFDPYGTVIRADLAKRPGRPTIGTIIFNAHDEALRAYNGLHGKHTCEGINTPLKIQYAKDSIPLGETLKKTIDAVAECIQNFHYKPSVLQAKGSKDFLNRAVLGRKKPPPTDVLTAALLVHAHVATADELVQCQMIKSTGIIQQLLADKVEPPAAKPAAKPAAAGKKEANKPIKLDNTFDAVVPYLDKLEQERWNRMAKANLRLNEYRRFRFVDILATPSLELWRWMVEDCRITPAEAATCFAILQNYYGFTK